MPWAGNIAKTMTSNGKQFTVTREMLTAVARDQSVQMKVAWFCRRTPSAFFKICFCFVLLYNKSLNDWSLGKQWILFPSNLNVSLDFVSGNIEILGKQNSLFPSGPVTKCLLFNAMILRIALAIRRMMKLVVTSRRRCVRLSGPFWLVMIWQDLYPKFRRYCHSISSLLIAFHVTPPLRLNFAVNPRMRTVRDGASRAGKSQPDLLGWRTGILSIARARCELKQLCCYINPDFSVKMSDVSEHSEFDYQKKKKGNAWWSYN